MTDLAAIIVALFTRFETALWQVRRPDRAYNDRLQRVANRCNRIRQRLLRLFALWQSNALPKQRPSRAGKPRKPAPPKPEGWIPFPRGYLWLLHNNWQINGAASNLNHELQTPAFQEFLAAVPQAGRVLRPLLHILHITPPAVIALPPRAPRKPRPKKPRFRRDPKPPRVYGGVVARNAVRDCAGNIKATLETVRQTDYRDTG